MEDTLTSIRNRVRFKLYTNISREEYTENIKEYLYANSDHFTGNINSESATIYVKNENTAFWKPNLALRSETEDGKTAIRGIFGPSSAVWTFYMFLYFLFSVAWMTFFTMYYVEKQIKTNNYPWALSASFVTLGIIIIIYIASQVGQRLSQKEMKELRRFAEESTYPHENKTTSEA